MDRSVEGVEIICEHANAAVFNARRFLGTGEQAGAIDYAAVINYDAFPPEVMAQLEAGPGRVSRPAEQTPAHLQEDLIYEDEDTNETSVLLASWQLFLRDCNNFSHRFFRTDIYGMVNDMTPAVQRFRLLFPDLYEAAADYVDYRYEVVYPSLSRGTEEPSREHYGRFMQFCYGIMAQLVDLGDRVVDGKSVEEYDEFSRRVCLTT